MEFPIKIGSKQNKIIENANLVVDVKISGQMHWSPGGLPGRCAMFGKKLVGDANVDTDATRYR